MAIAARSVGLIPSIVMLLAACHAIGPARGELTVINRTTAEVTLTSADGVAMMTVPPCEERTEGDVLLGAWTLTSPGRDSFTGGGSIDGPQSFIVVTSEPSQVAVRPTTIPACQGLLQAGDAAVPTATSSAAFANASPTPRLVSNGFAEIEDAEGQARAYIAAHTHTNPGDWELVNWAYTTIGQFRNAAWSGKYVNRQTDESSGAIVLPGGQVYPLDAFQDLVAIAESALTDLERKGDPSIDQFMACAEPGTIGSVGVFLVADTSAAEAAVIDAHPDVTWEGNRPMTDDAQLAASLEAELTDARSEVFRSVANAFAEKARTQLDAKIGYASTVAPLIFIELPKEKFDELAAFPEVTDIGMNGTGEVAGDDEAGADACHQ